MYRFHPDSIYTKINIISKYLLTSIDFMVDRGMESLGDASTTQHTYTDRMQIAIKFFNSITAALTSL